MSYKSLKLNVWKSPATGEVRIYVDARYVDRRDAIHDANGAWIAAGQDGMAEFHHRPMSNADSMWIGMQSVAAFLAGKLEPRSMAVRPDDIIGMTFADLLYRVGKCATKSGNFSATQYEHLFNTVANAA